MAYLNPTGNALRQGDVLANVRTFSLSNLDDETAPKGVVHKHSYSVIVTQDCDLEQDYATRFPGEGQEGSPDKLLFGVILCGVHEETALKAGRHRPQAKVFSKREWKPVTQNQDPRYQYLGAVPGAGTTLVADFKDYFMVSCDFLYGELNASRATRAAEMTSPYKEHLLQRFAWYLMRVGLPVNFADLPSEFPVLD